MARQGPTVQRRRLGLELRALREQAGKTLQDAAQVLRCSESRMSRIETGHLSASPGDILQLLDLYAVDDERRGALVQVARQARKRNWWQAYGDTVVVPLVGLEAGAERIHQYAAMAIPGLLQTSSYAQAIIEALRPDLPSEQIARRVELRMSRQRILAQGGGPPIFVAILEEAVVRRPVGGQSAMREQLRRLAEASGLPTVTLQILPLRVGAHAGMSGTFTIYGFSEPDPDVVYLEEYLDYPYGDIYLEGREQVRQYTSAFDRIRAQALSPDDSIDFLASVERDLPS